MLAGRSVRLKLVLSTPAVPVQSYGYRSGSKHSRLTLGCSRCAWAIQMCEEITVGRPVFVVVANMLHFLKEFSHADRSEGLVGNREMLFRPYESGNWSTTWVQYGAGSLEKVLQWWPEHCAQQCSPKGDIPLSYSLLCRHCVRGSCVGGCFFLYESGLCVSTWKWTLQPSSLWVGDWLCTHDFLCGLV